MNRSLAEKFTEGKGQATSRGVGYIGPGPRRAWAVEKPRNCSRLH